MWTTPFYGLTHYCPPGETWVTAKRWATVQLFDDGAALSLWHRNCVFSPEHLFFDDMGDAKRAGEAWADRGAIVGQ